MFSRCEICGAERKTINDCYILAIKKPLVFVSETREPDKNGRVYIEKHVCVNCAKGTNV